MINKIEGNPKIQIEEELIVGFDFHRNEKRMI